MAPAQRIFDHLVPFVDHPVRVGFWHDLEFELPVAPLNMVDGIPEAGCEFQQGVHILEPSAGIICLEQKPSLRGVWDDNLSKIIDAEYRRGGTPRPPGPTEFQSVRGGKISLWSSPLDLFTPGPEPLARRALSAEARFNQLIKDRTDLVGRGRYPSSPEIRLDDTPAHRLENSRRWVT